MQVKPDYTRYLKRAFLLTTGTRAEIPIEPQAPTREMGSLQDGWNHNRGFVVDAGVYR